MTQEPLNIKQILEEFDEKFVPSSLKWKDAIHCTCCSTEEEYEEIKKFLTASLREAMEAVKPKIDYPANCQECWDEMEIQYEERLDENITNFFKE